MGFLTNPKTGKRMTADEFIQREKKEWGEALKTFGKEIAGVGRKIRQDATLEPRQGIHRADQGPKKAQAALVV